MLLLSIGVSNELFKKIYVELNVKKFLVNIIIQFPLKYNI